MASTKKKPFKVLLVGGSGTISHGTAKLALSRGMELYVLNRGLRNQFIPEGAKLIAVDYNDEEAVKEKLKGMTFDTVVDYRIFNIAQLEKAFRIFTGKTKQYIYISSGTVYKKPSFAPVTEDAPKGNIHSLYARNKLACERRLLKEVKEKGFPGVIVRPSLTYNDFDPLLSFNCKKDLRYTLINRMRKDKKIIVQGDGTSFWTITHSDDFAKGIVGLFGNPATIGEDFHITSDEVLDWNTIYTELAHAAGVDIRIVHIASDYIGEITPKRRDGLLGDHSYSVIFDNSKIKKFVPDFKCTIPWAEGCKRIVEWYDADPAARQGVDEEFDAEYDMIINTYESSLRK